MIFIFKKSQKEKNKEWNRDRWELGEVIGRLAGEREIEDVCVLFPCSQKRHYTFVVLRNSSSFVF